MKIQEERFFYEKDLQRKVITAIRRRYEKDVWLYKASDNNYVGIPDIILCFFGHFVAIELKRGYRHAKRYGKPDLVTEKGSGMQQYNIKHINMACGSSFFARSVSVVMQRLEKIKETLTSGKSLYNY